MSAATFFDHTRYLGLVLCLVILSGCAARTDGPVLQVPEGSGSGITKTIFMGTTRARDAAGRFTFDRAKVLELLKVQVAIPADREIGTVSDGHQRPDANLNFVMSERATFDGAGAFQDALRREIARSGSADREVTVFVHGFNNSFTDAAFRIAQIAHDLELPGAYVSYAWPSRGNPLGYEYDRDSALFARDGLEKLLRNVQASGAPRMILVAHSMGSGLVMETLRQMEIAEPGWAARHLRGVVLISPDVNPEVFRAQLSVFEKVPDPFLVIVSRKDIILRISAVIRGDEERLGNLQDAASVADLPIRIVDVSDFRDAQSGNHFVAAGSPALLQLLRGSRNLDIDFLRGSRGATALRPDRQSGEGIVQAFGG